MAVQIVGKEGIAFYDPTRCGTDHPDGHIELVHHEDCRVVVMVGDDYRWHVDKSDIIELADDEFCGGCGQIGCGHG